MEQDCPGLSHFFGAYLNQDYDLTAETVEGVLAAFVAENSGEIVSRLRSDADRFLRENADDLDGEFGRRYGFDFEPKSWGYSVKSFLEWLLTNTNHSP